MKTIDPSVSETNEIYIRLAQYDDIFSDFDMRPYSRRALSVDFLGEIKRASIDKMAEGIELILHAPEKDRNESQEATIKERLAAHFKRHYQILQKDKWKVMRLGYSMVALGIVCMIIATQIIYRDPTDDLLLSFLVVFFEPAAWFLLWEGMDKMMFDSKEINPDLEFYKKMSEAVVHFKSY
jgi:hypothetical protein